MISILKHVIWKGWHCERWEYYTEVIKGMELGTVRISEIK